MLPLNLIWEPNPAKLMDKDYTLVCDPCLLDWPNVPNGEIHCLSCHETFGDHKLWELHRNARTSGCRYPGNLDRFYEVQYWPDIRVWHQKPDPNEVKNNR